MDVTEYTERTHAPALVPGGGTDMSVGRNDPCPCGSGLKFKKCHGAVIPVAAIPARQCGECTACCDGWVAGVIEGHEM